jgi:putative GTP pyrophosphokinase
MIVEIPVFFAKGKTPMRVELLHSARAIIEADNEMQRIKDKIGMLHEI